jgi:hypothetical protein
MFRQCSSPVRPRVSHHGVHFQKVINCSFYFQADSKTSKRPRPRPLETKYAFLPGARNARNVSINTYQTLNTPRCVYMVYMPSFATIDPVGVSGGMKVRLFICFTNSALSCNRVRTTWRFFTHFVTFYCSTICEVSAPSSFCYYFEVRGKVSHMFRSV